jgi:hypothetical protein
MPIVPTRGLCIFRFHPPCGLLAEHVPVACKQSFHLQTLQRGFIACQVAFVVIVIPCAIAFARLQTWLLNSSQVFHQLSTEFPNMTVVLLWILPTLIVTFIACAQFAKHFVEFRRAV